MLIQWRESLNIGVSEIDAEHRYLVALINNVHDDFAANTFERHIPDAFAHLTQYVIKHFRNEEALMAAAGYPILPDHIRLHEHLTDELSDLTEKYLAGENHISNETMVFLKDWLIDHVMEQDQRIGQYLAEKGVPKSWNYTPAYAEGSATHFKECTCCDSKWKTFQDLAADKSIKVLGCMPDQTNDLYNIIIFNCSCGTTLAIPLTDFIDNGDHPFDFENNESVSVKPDYCLRKTSPGPCLTRCACAYTNEILKALNYQG